MELSPKLIAIIGGAVGLGYVAMTEMNGGQGLNQSWSQGPGSLQQCPPGMLPTVSDYPGGSTCVPAPGGQDGYGPQTPAAYGPQSPAGYNAQGPQGPGGYGPQGPGGYGPQGPGGYGPQGPGGYAQVPGGYGPQGPGGYGPQGPGGYGPQGPGSYGPQGPGYGPDAGYGPNGATVDSGEVYLDDATEADGAW